MEQATAWILDIGHELNVAIGKYEMVHLIEKPDLLDESMQGEYCSYQMQWQGEEIPVADISACLNPSDSTTRKNLQPELVAIVAYETDESELPSYGGLVLNAIPERQLVTNDQACTLPEPQANWQKIAISCFTDNSQATPILDLPRIFSNELN